MYNIEESVLTRLVPAQTKWDHFAALILAFAMWNKIKLN